MATVINEKVLIQFDTNSKKLQRDFNKIRGDTKKTTDSIEKSFKSMATAIGAAFAIQGLKSLVRYADAYTNLSSQVKLVTDSNTELAATQYQLYKIAQDSRVSLEATTNLYTKLARATEDSAISSEELLTVTETINKAMIVSGASASETTSVITQLSQGLASGVLRGDEFNSIMENGSRVAKMLSDSLGVTLGELRAMSQDGGLTTDIMLEAIATQAGRSTMSSIRCLRL